MAVKPRNIRFELKLITHNIEVDPHMCFQSADVCEIKTRHLATNTAHTLYDKAKSYRHMCFKFFKGSGRAP